MKYLSQAKKFGSKVKAKVAVGSLLLVSASPAFATGTTDDIWAAVDLAGITAKVIAAGVLIIGIRMAFKSITLGKRAVNAA